MICCAFPNNNNGSKAFIESKFCIDTTIDDTIGFLDRAITDYRSHSTLAEVLYKVSISVFSAIFIKVDARASKRFLHTCQMADVESLGRLCKVLSEHDNALDIISLHAPLQDVIAHALACLEDYDLTTVGELGP